MYLLGLDFLLNLCAKPASLLPKQARRIIHCIQTGTRCVISVVEGNLGYQIHDADRDRVLMRFHAVHAKDNQSKSFTAPIERTVEMSLRSETAIVAVCHFVQ